MAIAPGQTGFRNARRCPKSKRYLVAPTDGSRGFGTSIVGGDFYRFTRPFRFNGSDLIFRPIPADYRRTLRTTRRIMELTDESLSGDGVERLTSIPRYPTAVVVRLTGSRGDLASSTIVWRPPNTGLD